MNQPVPVPLQKPRGNARGHIVELYEDETAYGVAESDTSIVKMLNDVAPQAAFPPINLSLFDFGDAARTLYADAMQVGQTIGNAIESIGQSMTSGGSGHHCNTSATDVYGNPPSR